jgi:splicing factor 45
LSHHLGRYDDHWSRDQESDEHARSVALHSPPPALPSAPVETAMTGEEAYLRRLAMSSRSRPAPPEVTSIASSAPMPEIVNDKEEAYERRADASRPPPPPPFDGAAFAPPPLVPPPPPALPSTVSIQPAPDLEARIKAQRDAAAAIAARLAAIAPTTEATSAPTGEPSTSSESKCVSRHAMNPVV